MEAYVLSNADISKTYYTVKFNTSQEKNISFVHYCIIYPFTFSLNDAETVDQLGMTTKLGIKKLFKILYWKLCLIYFSHGWAGNGEYQSSLEKEINQQWDERDELQTHCKKNDYFTNKRMQVFSKS